MRVLAGFERPSAGSIGVAGLQLGSLSARRLADYRAATLGYADQHYWRALAGRADRRGADRCPARAAGRHGAGAAGPSARPCSIASACATAPMRTPVSCRVASSSALRSARRSPTGRRLLIADEPTGELDELSAAAVYALLAELSREEGVTALVVSHDPRSAAIADRVVHIRDGRVSEERSGESSAVVIGRGGWVRISGGCTARRRHRRPGDGERARGRCRAAPARRHRRRAR